MHNFISFFSVASNEECQVSVICLNVIRSKDPSFYQLNSCV